MIVCTHKKTRIMHIVLSLFSCGLELLHCTHIIQSYFKVNGEIIWLSQGTGSKPWGIWKSEKRDRTTSSTTGAVIITTIEVSTKPVAWLVQNVVHTYLDANITISKRTLRNTGKPDDVCQILEQYDHYNIQSHGFETPQHSAVRRPSA